MVDDSPVAAATANAPAFSVVVPVHDGAATIDAVVAALLAQEGAPSFEILLVDDGSTDATPKHLEAWAGRTSLRVIRQANKGPAAARNAGVLEARGACIAFLGDDTIPQPGWLAAHAAAHARARQHTHPAPVAVVGHTAWHRTLRPTAFLRWLESAGKQFGYALIEDPDDLPFTLLYGSNLSLARALIVLEPFDARFPFAAWEDVDLGYRLTRRGIRIHYSANARAEHLHPTSLRRFCRRQELVGFAALLLYRLHPELAEMLGISAAGPRRVGSVWMHRWRKLLALLLERLPLSLPETWERVLMHHFDVGLRRAWDEAAWLEVGQAASAARTLATNPSGSPYRTSA